VAGRLSAAVLFARTGSIQVRLPDFSTFTRSRTLSGATDGAEAIGSVAATLLEAVNLAGGVRLLGVGVAGLTDLRQQELFSEDHLAGDHGDVVEQHVVSPGPLVRRWLPGVDVAHDDHGRGWVWGSGRGRVTVRFETRDTPPGPVRTFAEDDPQLHRVHPA